MSAATRMRTHSDHVKCQNEKWIRIFSVFWIMKGSALCHPCSGGARCDVTGMCEWSGECRGCQRVVDDGTHTRRFRPKATRLLAVPTLRS